MKIGDLVEMSAYGHRLQCRWKERGKVGIIVEAPRWDMFRVRWVGSELMCRRNMKLFVYDRRELKFARKKNENR